MLKELAEGHWQDAWAFQGGIKTRVIELAIILKGFMDKSDGGKLFQIDEPLNVELKQILQSACYLFNSASFREGRYYDFDRDEIDRKLRRRRP